MTLKTCKDQLALAEKKGNKEKIEFWKARIAKKYPNAKIEADKPKKK